ncbi:MAG: hypothetical protein V4671_14600 [Armatimonadota bacterium]
MISRAFRSSWVPLGFKDGIYSVLFSLVVLYWAINCLLSALLPLLAFSVSGLSIEEEIGYDE